MEKELQEKVKQKLRNRASYVDIAEPPTTTYKYSALHRLRSKVLKSILNIKRKKNTELQKITNRLKRLEFKKASWDLFLWLFDACFEGFALAIPMHFIFGFPFNIWYILSFGILVVQIPAYVGRLIQDGKIRQLRKKD